MLEIILYKKVLFFFGVFLQEYLRGLLVKHNNFEVEGDDFIVVLQPFFTNTVVPKLVSCMR